MERPTAVTGRIDLFNWALIAADRGWRVFPLAPGHKVPRRQLTDWETKATSDPDRIARWWTRHPTDNVGIATGPSGLVVVDLDTPKPGDDPNHVGERLFLKLVADAGERLPTTWMVFTPSGGLHLYYRAPEVPRLRNTAGRIGVRIDTRALGGYVVAAGSVVDGRQYRAGPITDPAELPAWLAERLTPPLRLVAPPRPVGRARGYVQGALTAEVQRVLDAPTGARNHTLNTAAWALGRFVTQGVLDRHVVEAALQTAGEATGLSPREAAATVQSALTARLRRPAGGTR